MKRIAAVLAAVLACGGKYQAPPPQKSIALPTGAQLKPYDPAHPGNANPQGLTQVGDKVYATISNQYFDAAAKLVVNAGPGFLAAIVPSSTNTPALIDLGGADGKQCQNPGFVRDSNGLLYAPCSGDFSGSDSGRALVEVDPATARVTRRAAIPDGRVPNGVAPGPKKIWMGDAFSLQVFSVDRATFTADTTNALTLDCPQSATHGFSYVADVLILFGDLYALCASDIAGTLFRFDAATGALKGRVDVGPTPSELAATGDGRIAVINSGDNTLSLVTVGTTLTANNKALTFPDGTSVLQDVRARDNFLFTVASGSNSAQKIDLSAKGGPKIVAAASFDNGANPYNILPLDDDQAIVTNRQTNSIAAAQWVVVP